MKRILAIIGAVLLVLMYAMTLIAALSSSENYWNLLMASAACTIIVPVLLYAYGLIYRLLKGRGKLPSGNGSDVRIGGDGLSSDALERSGKEGEHSAEMK